MQIVVRVLVAVGLALSVALVVSAKSVAPTDAINHVGQKAEVCGVVSSAKYAPKVRGAPTFLNIGAPYPNEDFTAVVWGTTRARFPSPPETLQGTRVCVSGVISVYRGKPQIEVADPAQIRSESSEK
jgi:hypothetical protein